jgi:hypothetical protein
MAAEVLPEVAHRFRFHPSITGAHSRAIAGSAALSLFIHFLPAHPSNVMASGVTFRGPEPARFNISSSGLRHCVALVVLILLDTSFVAPRSGMAEIHGGPSATSHLSIPYILRSRIWTVATLSPEVAHRFRFCVSRHSKTSGRVSGPWLPASS